jgi:cytoskeletal protein RodZ
MKQCPKCNSSFPDADKFCEVDGTVLVAAEDPTHNTTSNPARDKKILPLLAVIGALVGVLSVFVYLTFLRGSTTQEVSASSTNQAQLQVSPSLPSPVSPAPLESPSIEPSPSPSPSPSVQASPSPQASATPVELNSTPIATKPGAPAQTGQVRITLVSGAKIEAEEVWQTGEGVWYRKGTIISLLDPKNVKSIDKVPATPAPTVAKAPSP